MLAIIILVARPWTTTSVWPLSSLDTQQGIVTLLLFSCSVISDSLWPHGPRHARTTEQTSASASVLPVNIQDWSPLGWTGWISLQSKGLSRVFSNNTVQKHRSFSGQSSLSHYLFCSHSSPSTCHVGCSRVRATSKTAAAAAKSLQSCQTLCDPIDGSPPGSPVPGILQARTLEWAAISFCTSKTGGLYISYSCVW